MKLIHLLLATLVFSLPLVTTDNARAAPLTPVDLTSWTPESYPVLISEFPNAVWYTSPWYAYQYTNAQPTLLYSDFPALWTAIEGYIRSASGYDDIFGYAVGFLPGDAANPGAEYYIVDWKRGTQYADFIDACTPGSTAPAGIAVSRVFGIPTADEFWGHVNFDSACSDLNHGVQELLRGSNLGATGWWYAFIPFRLEYRPTNLKVYVDGVLEIDLDGDFAQGRWAFYNFSQAATYYAYPGYPLLRELLLPVYLDIKFCSNPNALNCKKKGKNPLTIFGSEDLDVTQIDLESLWLCLADDPEVCTPSGPQSWSLADRGDPTTDLGADQCTIDPETGLEFLNPDGYVDLDVAFDAAEVAALVGCGDLGKGDVTATLVVHGLLLDGTEFISQVQHDVGIDQYLIQ